MALKKPERLHKVILMSPSATIQKISLKFIVRVILTLINKRYYAKFFHWIFEDYTKGPKYDQNELEYIISESILNAECFKPFDLVVPTVLSDDELNQFKIPVLFMVGENDKSFSIKKAVRRLELKAPHINVEILENAGHGMIIAKPDKVNAIIVHFLSK